MTSPTGASARRPANLGETSAEKDVKIELDDLQDIACGAGFLGVGGGGDPYIGYLVCKAAIQECGPPDLIQPNDLHDDALVVTSVMIGAPTVTTEKCISGEDAVFAVKKIEEKLGREVDAIVCAEIGGLNSLLPVMTAARMGLPVIDADGCGRAVPCIDMTVWCAGGIMPGAVALVNDHLDVVMIEADDARRAEDLSRAAVTAMGLSVMSSMYPMSAEDMRRTSVPNTMSIARDIGRAVRNPGQNTPVDSLLRFLKSTPHYSACGILCTGKVMHVERETRGGFAFGLAKIQGNDGNEYRIDFQNEYLNLVQDGRLLAMAPDLVSIVDAESAMPISTEALRFGQRVSVVGTSAPELLRSEKALENCGPKRFDIGDLYTPIEKINGWAR